MKPTISMLAVLIGLTMAGVARAQVTPAAQQVETIPAAQTAPQSPPVTDWHPFSRSATRIYMVDVGGMAQSEGVVMVKVARVPLNLPEPNDYTHVIDDFELRCAADESRTTVSTEYGPDGVQTDRFEEESPWEGIRRESLDAYLKGIVCDGNRSAPPTWPSIQAFIDVGRR